MCRDLMYALESGGQASSAMELLNQMKEAEIDIDLDTYKCVLRTLLTSGDWYASVRLLEDIIKDGLSPDEEAVTVVVHACRNADRPKIANQILKVT